MGRKKQSPLPPYLAWREGRPRWVPGPAVRAGGFHGRDLKDAGGRWLGLEAAIAAAADLNREVAAWRDGGTARRRAKPPRATRTCRQLYDQWIATPEFRHLAASTRRDYHGKAQIWLDAFGDEPVAAVGRAALKGWWRQQFEARGHAQANGIIAVARAMLTFATDLEWIETNPAFKLKLMAIEPRVAFWSPAKVSAFVATADAIGQQAVADAVIIALHSAQRQGDVLAMPARLFDDGRVRLTQFKRGALVDAPMTQQLANRVAHIRMRWRAADVAARETIITDKSGRAMKGDYFRNLFALVRDEAARQHPELCAAERMQPGLPDLRFADLRDTAITRLALADCTLPQIASISGHSPDHITSVIKHYLAICPAMADAAIAKLSTWLGAQDIAL